MRWRAVQWSHKLTYISYMVRAYFLNGKKGPSRPSSHDSLSPLSFCLLTPIMQPEDDATLAKILYAALASMVPAGHRNAGTG